MNFNDQRRSCHAERSEASRGPWRETFRFAQGDNPLPISLVKLHKRPLLFISLENETGIVATEAH